MTVASSYIPAQDAPALGWMKNFSGHITARPGAFACSEADALSIAYVVAEFEDALALVNDPATRSPVAISAKNAKRATAEQLCRHYGIQIKVNLGISDEDKIAVGIRPINYGRVPAPKPGSSPLLNIIAATPGAHTLRYADTMTPDSGRKPAHVACLQLFRVVADVAIDDGQFAQFYASITRNPIGVAFTDSDDGKIATYFARWANTRGEVGPWSLPVSMRIAA